MSHDPSFSETSRMGLSACGGNVLATHHASFETVDVLDDQQNISGFDRFGSERAHVNRTRVVDEPFGFRIGKK